MDNASGLSDGRPMVTAASPARLSWLWNPYRCPPSSNLPVKWPKEVRVSVKYPELSGMTPFVFATSPTYEPLTAGKGLGIKLATSTRFGFMTKFRTGDWEAAPFQPAKTWPGPAMARAV